MKSTRQRLTGGVQHGGAGAVTNARIVHHINDTVELYETMLGGLGLMPSHDIGRDNYSSLVVSGLRNLYRERIVALKTAANVLECRREEATEPMLIE